MYVKEGSRNFWKFSKLSNSTTDDSSSFAELLCYLLLSNVETLGLAKETNSKCFKMISKGGKCFRNHSKPSKTSPEVIFERIHILWYSRPELGLGRPVRRAWARVNTWILTFSSKINFGRMNMRKRLLWPEICQFNLQKPYRTCRTLIFNFQRKSVFHFLH